MNDAVSRIVNVIETKQGDQITFFTLEGVKIGGFKGGTRVEPQPTQETSNQPKGGVIKPMTPHQVQRAHDREAAKLLTPESKIKHLIDDVA